jgi:hypothetical protein
MPESMTKEQIAEKAMDWVFGQGPTTVILFCLSGFIAYERIHVQPIRATEQREHEKQVAVMFQSAFESTMKQIRSENDRLLQAIYGRDYEQTLRIGPRSQDVPNREDNTSWNGSNVSPIMPGITLPHDRSS